MPQTLEPRTAQLSRTEMAEIVLPQHANALGTVFGGTVMSWIDICAAITANRHCSRTTVTVTVDDLTFLAPMRIGDVVRLTGRVNGAFSTSLEVGVRVEVEDTQTMTRQLCVEAFLTFVALGEDRRPTRVPPLLLEDENSKRRQQAAEGRRKARLERRAQRSQRR